MVARAKTGPSPSVTPDHPAGQVMRVDIFSDPICPWCFIGKRRLEAALALRPEIAAHVVWRPFMLNPDMPDGGMERGSYLAQKFGSAERAAAVYAGIRQSGVDAGIDFRFADIRRTPATLTAHRLIHAVQHGGHDADGDAGDDAPAVAPPSAPTAARADRLVEAIFAAYFLHGLDIGAIPVLLQLAETCGIASEGLQDYLTSGRDAERVRADDALARELGFDGAPGFVIAGAYAVPGAQSPELLCRVFDAALEASGAGAGAG